MGNCTERKFLGVVIAKPRAVETDERDGTLMRVLNMSSGADIRSVCTKAGMFAIRAR